MRKYTSKEVKYPKPEHAPSHLLISFDLGKRKVGVAVFLCDDRMSRLIGAEVLQLEGEWSADKMAQIAHSALSPMISQAFMPICLVCEWPQKYAKARKFHKDLDSLHAVGHAIVRSLSSAWSETYTPSEWKGNVPKKAHRKRLDRELSLAERCALQKHVADNRDTSLEEAAIYLSSEESHDLWDAIGIGLFATARTRKGGTRV